MSNRKPFYKSQRVRLMTLPFVTGFLFQYAIHGGANPESGSGNVAHNISGINNVTHVSDTRTSLEKKFYDEAAKLDQLTYKDPTQDKIDTLLSSATDAYLDYFDNVVRKKHHEQASANYAKAQNFYNQVLVLDPENVKALRGIKLLNNIKSIYDK